MERKHFHSGTGNSSEWKMEEFEDNSEDEMFPNWIKLKMLRNIDDSTRANHGEKELKKLWNLHVIKHKQVNQFRFIDSRA